MKNFICVLSFYSLTWFFCGCKEKSNQPPPMISLPQFEFSAQISKNDSTRKINLSLDAFFISNEITNREYREFTDWAKTNPDEVLAKPKGIVIQRNPEPGQTKVWTLPNFVKMSDLLPSLIDSNAMYKVDKRYKDYFTDGKYNDYPVVGVSRSAAEYYCIWLTLLEREKSVIRKGQTLPDGTKSKKKHVIISGPSYGYYRIPDEMEWEYISKQPYKRKYVNDHQLHKVKDGNVNRWGVFHIHDNVSEWVSSTDDTLAIVRGQNWRSEDNTADRFRTSPDSSNGVIGFRIARTYKPETINDKEEHK